MADNISLIIVVEAKEEQREVLRLAIEAGAMAQIIHAVSTFAEAEALIVRGTLTLCVIGDSFPDSEKFQFVQSQLKKGGVALVFVSSSHERDRLVHYVKSGAHGILLYPPDPQSVGQVLAAAQQTYQTQASFLPKQHEQVTSLPWLLERVSRELDLVAESLIDSNEISARRIEEALLRAFIVEQ